MLRFFDYVELASASTGGIWIAKTLWLALANGKRLIPARLLIARPLWWLAAILLSVPDARARYAEFSVRALAQWEDFLLGSDR